MTFFNKNDSATSEKEIHDGMDKIDEIRKDIMENKKDKLFTKIASLISVFLSALGESVWLILKNFLSGLFTYSVLLIKLLWKKTENGRRHILNLLKYIGIFFSSPFLKFLRNTENVFKESIKARKEKGIFAGLLCFLRNLGSYSFGKNGIAITLFNYALPVVSVVFLYNIIVYTLNIDYGVELYVNGDYYGYIENEQVLDEAEKFVESRLSFLGSSKMVEVEPEYEIKPLGKNEPLTSTQVADLILSNSDISVEYAYGIYLNDALVGAVTDNTKIERTLNDILDKYRTNNADEEVNFVQKVDYAQPGLYTSESIVDPDRIVNQLKTLKSEAQYYEVEAGDSHSLICDILDMTMAEIEYLNPGFTESDLNVGDLIKYSVDVPFLDVSITNTEVYEEEVPFSTEYQDDNSLYIGTTSIYRSGEPGIVEKTDRVSRVNNTVIKRENIKKRKISNPVSKIVLEGTKPTPQGTFSTSTASYGKFIWPIAYSDLREISELHYSDGGYYGHTGIDFMAPYGTPIYAGASGTVVMASSYYYGYGMCIQIDHPNGLRTLYAHCSSILVSVGEQVSQGQCIGLVGATGKAWGNHCHFEVRQGNTIHNPRHYLDNIPY